MVKIASKFQTIYKETGLNIEEDLLYVRLNLDAPHVSSPLLVKKGEETYLLVRDGERGNFDGEQIPATVLYFNTYEKFNDDDGELPRDWVEIVREIACGDEVEVDDELHVGAVFRMSEAFPLMVNSTSVISQLFSYQVDTETVKKAFSACYGTGLQDARKLVSGLEQKERILKLLDGGVSSGERFSYLDTIVHDLKLDAILLSSPLNVQEVTGLPYEYLKTHEVIAVYSPGMPVNVISYSSLDFPHLQLNRIHKNVREAVAAWRIHQKITIGIEEDHLPYRYALELGLGRGNLIPVGEKLRYWREFRAPEDLPFYLVAAQATISGINETLKYAEELITTEREFTETEIQRHLYENFARFLAKNELRVRIVPYFIVLHAGQRTTYPNKPSFDVLKSSDTKSLRLDCGVFVIDERGLLRATSDLCRTLTLQPEAKELYTYLARLMISRAVPAIMPGKRGADIYREGVREMFSSDQTRWIAKGLLPESGLTRYRRHIGHVMGKQEPSTVVFEEGNEGVLKNGMVCCLEYHWLRGHYAIGVEDMFLVTSEGAVNITH